MKKLMNDEQQGSIIVSILVITLFLTTFIFSLIILANSNLVLARNRIFLLQSQYAAESGADTVVAQFNNGNTTYGGSGGEVQILSNNLYRSTYSTTVTDGVDSKEKIVTAIGKVYAPANNPTATQTRKIEVTVQRSGTTFSTGLMARNIIYVESGVKNLTARDIFANGFVWLNKNTTNLIAENITIADKNTGASNCSLGGTGNLVKPTSFNTPGQTKTNIKFSYNNCISPPGNLSNSDFDVTVNQPIPKVQSTFIPWSQYMDASYQNAPGGCNDWTTGSFPRDIPSTGNTKKTHYPDSGNNISLSCGVLGDLYLQTGQYNIHDHVHVRANFCLVLILGCTPTFNNPDSTLKFVFVEGAINFKSIQTAPGSGPIVFVSYGTDPLTHILSCPYGGSIYLGNSGNTSAPAAYFLALNGLCIDKTKFNSSPALGGLSAKNIYIASNPGTPFDLKLDPLFPVDEIPIDLAWRAVRYRRL